MVIEWLINPDTQHVTKLSIWKYHHTWKFYMYNNKVAKEIWIYIEFIPVLEWILIVGIAMPIGGAASSWGRTMMTSSNGNIFRVTGPLCGEFTGPGEFPTQRPVTRSFDVFFDLRLNKRLSKQPWGWWFEKPSRSLWRQCNAVVELYWITHVEILDINAQAI